MFKRFTVREWVMAAAVGFGLGGLLVVWLLSGHVPETALSLSASAFLAYAATGAAVWWFFKQRGFQFSVWRGAAIGLLVGLLALPVFWLIAVAVNFVFRVPMPALGYIVNPLDGLLLLPSFTIIAWTTISWASGALSGFIGGVLAYLEVRSLREPAARSRLAQILNVVGVVLLIAVLFLVVIGFFPVSTTGMESQPNPVTDYATAIARLEQIKADETAQPIVDVCRTNWMTHGEKTDKVVVFYHGLSNCPRQFEELGQEFFDRGYNVLIARFPEHVDTSRDPIHMTPTAEQFREMADTSIDLARGLGEHVYVMGLSGGGGVASWVAQYRSDVDRVVSIAPFYALGLLPPWLSQWATNLLTRLPNIPARAPSPIEYQYQGMSSMGVGESMRFAQVARQAAASNPMAAGSLMLVTNENDVAVSNSVARQVNEHRRALGAQVDEFIFERGYGLPHDVIDVHQTTANPGFVYPILIDLMEGRTPTLP